MGSAITIVALAAIMTLQRIHETLSDMIKPYTLFAAIASLLLLGVFFWWFQSHLVVTGIYLGIAALATVSVPLMYRLSGYSLADDAQWLQERENKEHAALSERLQGLKSELGALGLSEGLRQADALTEIINDYHSVVNTRFFGKKSSPLTYLGAARTVQRQATQNLADMVAVGHSLSGLSNNQRDRQWTNVDRRDRQDDLYAEQEKRLQSLLSENNRLFDALTETAVEIANIQSISEFERTDTLARLVALAEIANSTGK